MKPSVRTAASRGLVMVLPERWLRGLPRVRVPTDYQLRVLQVGEEGVYEALLRTTGSTEEDGVLEWTLRHALPGGIFLMIHRPTGVPAATAAALHNPGHGGIYFPFGGALANVRVLPEHKNRGLTYSCLLSALARLHQAGYRHVHVEVEEGRCASTRRFLMMGFVPYLGVPGAEGRWKKFCKTLDWPFSPEKWPRSSLAPRSP